jgi:hypothetical protein
VELEEVEIHGIASAYRLGSSGISEESVLVGINEKTNK